MILPVLLFLSIFTSESLRCKTDSDCPGSDYSCEPTAMLNIDPLIYTDFRCIRYQSVRYVYELKDFYYTETEWERVED